MVRPIQIRQPPVQSVPVVLSGGINEAVTTLELGPGELLECFNYFEIDGPYGGYTSVPGYEVYDGTMAPSAVPAPWIEGTDDFYDRDRELRRSQIQPLPGDGAVRGVHLYKGTVFGVRDGNGGVGKNVAKATDAGWSVLDVPAGALNAGGRCDWVNENFSKYPNTTDDYPPAMANVECWFMADGVSRPISYDGTTVRELNDGNLPCDPGFSPAPVFPTHVAAFDNRIWLAFPGGHLFYSELGDPGAWDGTNGAGSIPTGDEITDLIVAPGNVLVVFMRNSTKIVYIPEKTTADFTYQLKEFSPRSGCLPDMSDRLLGDIYYIDDRGPTSLKATERFGDFNETAITKKVQRTFLSKKDQITASVVQRSLNQWRIFFADNSGMCFTFHNKRIKGVTFFRYNVPVLCVTEGEDKDGFLHIFFGSDDGYVYEADSGTSFNGDLIVTRFVTSYHHYKYPQRNKRFMRLLFEISADNDMKFYIKTDYNYRSSGSPKNIEQTPEISGLGGVWGVDRWSQFIWGEAYIANPMIYIEGIGVNMSVALRTEDKYRKPHVVHNFITDFTILDTRM